MEEIKVGEFVRTKKGDIYKFLKIDKNKRLLGEYFDDVIYVCSISRKINKEYRIKEYQISKHSFNIIDLIEEGDFVNSQRVEEISKDRIFLENMTGIYEEKEIDSILTKEQFEAMEYEVK